MPQKANKRKAYLEKEALLAKPDACSIWPFAMAGGNYGLLGVEGRNHLAHRYVWELANGPIPAGFYVLHTCGNPPCFNPHHLFLGTAEERGKETQHDYLKKTVQLCTPDACCEWPWHRDEDGYGRFQFKRRRYFAHRYAWELTNGTIPPELFICHHCDNPPCFNPFHLFLGTHLDNERDKVLKGRSLYGERHNQAYLTEAQVLEIRQKYSKGIYSKAELGREYGVARTNIQWIVSRGTWKHLEGGKPGAVLDYGEINPQPKTEAA